jgi:spore germination cell wall hydrolase CwlJ-like protein
MKWLFCLLLLQSTALAEATHKNVVSEDIRCLAWAVSDESRGESRVVQRAVLDVLLFRMKDRGKSACSVIKAPHQFSGYKEGVLQKVSNKALQDFFFVFKMQTVLRASHFHSADMAEKPSWAYKFKKVATLGNLSFYRA